MRVLSARAIAICVALVGLFAMHGLATASASECHDTPVTYAQLVAEHEAHGHHMAAEPPASMTLAGIGVSSIDEHSGELCMAILTFFVLMLFSRRIAHAFRIPMCSSRCLSLRAQGRGPPDVELSKLSILRN